MSTSVSLSAPAQGEAGPRSERRGIALMAAGGVVLGTIGIFLVEAAQPPQIALLARCLFGAATLALWALASGRWRELRWPREAGAAVLGTGLLMALNWLLFFAAIPLTSIAVATVVFHVQPFILIAIAAVVQRERIAASRLLAIAAALVGLTLASGVLGEPARADGGYALGLGMCLAGAFAYAGVTWLARRAARVGPLTLSWWQCVVGALAIAPWVAVSGGVAGTQAQWPWLVGLGIVHTGLAYVLLYAGIARLPAGRIALLQFVYPATAIVVDAAVYARPLEGGQWLGVALLGAALWSVGSAPEAARGAAAGQGR